MTKSGCVRLSVVSIHARNIRTPYLHREKKIKSYISITFLLPTMSISGDNDLHMQKYILNILHQMVSSIAIL